MKEGLAQHLLSLSGAEPQLVLSQNELRAISYRGREVAFLHDLVSQAVLERQPTGKGTYNVNPDALMAAIARSNGWAEPEPLSQGAWLLTPSVETSWGERAVCYCLDPSSRRLDQVISAAKAKTRVPVTLLVPEIPDRSLIETLGREDVGLVLAKACLRPGQLSIGLELDLRSLGPFLEPNPDAVAQPLKEARRHWGDREDARLFHETLLYGGGPLAWIVGQEESEEQRLGRRHRDVRERLEAQVLQRLREGSLRAEAFDPRVPVDKGRVQIAPSRWELLEPDFEQSAARDGDVLLSGILVSLAQYGSETAAPSDSIRLTIHSDSHRIILDGREVRLSAPETALMRALAEAVIAGRDLVKQSELHALCSPARKEDKAVGQAIGRLRKKLEAGCSSSAGARDLIQNIRTKGYQLRLKPNEVRLIPEA